MSHSYEVELKSLLGSKENADLLFEKLKKNDSKIKLINEDKQLNHYFNIPENVDLQKALSKLITKDKKDSFIKIAKEGKKLSLRSREIGGEKVILVIKASVGDDSSSNGVKRMELEIELNISLKELDSILLKAGLTYQAKWSRERREYESRGMHICIDKNAGYGYLAEFEKIANDENMLEQIRDELLTFMKDMGVEELAQDRLERMFAHYNANWEKYYGTDKVFIIN